MGLSGLSGLSGRSGDMGGAPDAPIAVASLSGIGTSTLTCDGSGSTFPAGQGAFPFQWGDGGAPPLTYEPADGEIATADVSGASDGTYDTTLTVQDALSQTDDDIHFVTVEGGVITAID